MSASDITSNTQCDLLSYVAVKGGAPACAEMAPIAPSGNTLPAPVVSTSGKRYLTVGEVATRFGVSRATIWRWTKRGLLPESGRVSERVTRWRIDGLAAFASHAGQGGAI